jgi:hypothetical protein
MGKCFSFEKSFPPSLYPHEFYKHTVFTNNIEFGQDFVNGNYVSKNQNTWFDPPFQSSSVSTNLSLDDFYLKFSNVS